MRHMLVASTTDGKILTSGTAKLSTQKWLLMWMLMTLLCGGILYNFSMPWLCYHQQSTANMPPFRESKCANS